MFWGRAPVCSARGACGGDRRAAGGRGPDRRRPGRRRPDRCAAGAAGSLPGHRGGRRPGARRHRAAGGEAGGPIGPAARAGHRASTRRRLGRGLRPPAARAAGSYVGVCGAALRAAVAARRSGADDGRSRRRAFPGSGIYLAEDFPRAWDITDGAQAIVGVVDSGNRRVAPRSELQARRSRRSINRASDSTGPAEHRSARSRHRRGLDRLRGDQQRDRHRRCRRRLRARDREDRLHRLEHRRGDRRRGQPPRRRAQHELRARPRRPRRRRPPSEVRALRLRRRTRWCSWPRPPPTTPATEQGDPGERAAAGRERVADRQGAGPRRDRGPVRRPSAPVRRVRRRDLAGRLRRVQPPTSDPGRVSGPHDRHPRRVPRQTPRQLGEAPRSLGLPRDARRRRRYATSPGPRWPPRRSPRRPR